MQVRINQASGSHWPSLSQGEFAKTESDISILNNNDIDQVILTSKLKSCYGLVPLFGVLEQIKINLFKMNSVCAKHKILFYAVD